MEQVGETCKQCFLGALVLGLVLQHFVAKGLAEVQSLQHRIAVARIPELRGEKLLSGAGPPGRCSTHVH